jgi:hypothetical protein
MEHARFSPQIGHADRMITKPKFVLCVALVLSGGLFGCSTTIQQQRSELTWPAVANGHWEWTPSIVSERFTHAATKALGSEKDLAKINKSIAADDLRQKLRVTELRWLSPKLAMARVSGENIRFDYVIEKKNGQWMVLVHYTRMILD